jgi:hypothetical protein
MVASTVDSCPLDREHIEVVLDDTEEMLITLLISTDRAKYLIHICHGMTLSTLMHLGVEIRECTCKIRYIRSIGLEEKKCELRRSLFPDSWEKMYHVYNALECFWHGIKQ